jgi:hypothetical protein
MTGKKSTWKEEDKAWPYIYICIFPYHKILHYYFQFILIDFLFRIVIHFIIKLISKVVLVTTCHANFVTSTSL